MNIEDVNVAYNERASSPDRYRSYASERLDSEYDRLHAENEARSRRRSQSRASREPRQEAVEEVEEEVISPTQSRRNDASRASSSVSSVFTTERESNAARSRHQSMRTISKASTKMERDIMEYIDRHRM